MSSPRTLVAVLGTATEVGKTWVACRLLEELRGQGVRVAARKPAQSFDEHDAAPSTPTDADLLARASGESPEDVCPPHRWYPVALAPPMAARRLGRPTVHLDELVDELRWPPEVEVGLVETAGGVCSPIAEDGDGAALARRLGAQVSVLVADAGLGTIHAVRSCVAALEGLRVIVVLNRFDSDDALHRENREWLQTRDGLDVVTDLAALARRVRRA